MEKNKKNKSLSLLLILAIISLVVLISSFAKYTGIAGTANDTAQVAKWSVTLDAQAGSIFTHTYSTNLKANAGTDKIIAPGVQGSYLISITNDGDVAAKVSEITITKGATSANVPLVFSLDNWVTTKTLEEINTTLTTEVASKTLQPGAASTELGTLYWKWEYNVDETSDTADTALGTASAEATSRTTYSLDMTVKAEQQQPGK